MASTRRLYERGFTRKDIIELLRFIGWVLVLPEELEQQLSSELTRYEEEWRMRYVTSWEQMGFEKGMEKGLQGLRQTVIGVLQARFSTVPDTVAESLESIGDISVLTELLGEAATVGTMDELKLHTGDSTS